MTDASDSSAQASYVRRVVGFVDILGFASLVNRADKNKSLRQEIVEALGKVQTTAAPKETTEDSDLRAHNFSDSLILSAKDTATGFWHLLLSLDALAWNLLQMGVLIRGGVTIGRIQHEEHIVFGVGVNEAYHLEFNIARKPRIALGKAAVKAASVFAANDAVWETYKNSRLLRDDDGVWFLNYLCELSAFSNQPTRGMGIEEHPLYITGNTIRSVIQNQVETILDRPDIYEKIAWLASYWNKEVAPVRNDGRQPLFEPIVLAGQEPRGLGSL